jgi:hypothetical protein
MTKCKLNTWFLSFAIIAFALLPQGLSAQSDESDQAIDAQKMAQEFKSKQKELQALLIGIDARLIRLERLYDKGATVDLALLKAKVTNLENNLTSLAVDTNDYYTSLIQDIAKLQFQVSEIVGGPTIPSPIPFD